MRKIQLVENEYYHIYNRGVDKRDVFLSDPDYLRFLQSMKEFNSIDPIGSLYEKYLQEKKSENPNGSLASTTEAKLPGLVEIICYCLNPNHYHFILKQLAEKGIEKFMQRLGTGYTKYFNQKYKRSGSLFQGTFKSSQIKSGALLYLSAYVNCNSEVHGIARAEEYRWSSYSDYLGKTEYGLCAKEVIMQEFKGGSDYRNFAEENMNAAKEKKLDEKLCLE
jgi:putative transposase